MKILNVQNEKHLAIPKCCQGKRKLFGNHLLETNDNYYLFIHTQTDVGRMADTNDRNVNTPQNKNAEGPKPLEVVTEIQTHKVASNGTTVQPITLAQKLVVILMYSDSHKQTDVTLMHSDSHKQTDDG
jgi:hypothetical protein